MTRVQFGKATVDLRFDQEDIEIVRGSDQSPPRTPVKTGRLRDGFHIESGSGDIINETPYGAFVEFGTVRLPGRFMCAQSIPELAERMKERIAKELAGQMMMDPIEIRIGVTSPFYPGGQNLNKLDT